MPYTRLDEIIHEVTSRGLIGQISLATEKFAEELAREAMNDPEFKEQWWAAVREAARRMLPDLQSPAPPRRKRK